MYKHYLYQLCSNLQKGSPLFPVPEDEDGEVEGEERPRDLTRFSRWLHFLESYRAVGMCRCRSEPWHVKAVPLAAVGDSIHTRVVVLVGLAKNLMSARWASSAND